MGQRLRWIQIPIRQRSASLLTHAPQQTTSAVAILHSNAQRRLATQSAIGRSIQPPMLLWPKPLDLRLERGFDRPVRRLNSDHARPGIANTTSLADALDLRTLLREFASAQGRACTLHHMRGPPDARDIGSCRCVAQRRENGWG